MDTPDNEPVEQQDAPQNVANSPAVIAEGRKMMLERSGSVSKYSFAPQNFAELQAFCSLVANSDLAPKDYKGRPGNVLLAVQMGSEIGLSPMIALQNIAVISGRPAVFGDAALALIKQHPLFVSCEEWREGEGDSLVAHCRMIRRGEPPYLAKFSVADAKKAKLWGKQGPWCDYPERMMQMRARGFCGRDAFPDALKGIFFAEEAMDIPNDETVVAATVEPSTPRTDRVLAKLEQTVGATEPLHDKSKTAEERVHPRTGNAKKCTPEQLSALEDYAQEKGLSPEAFDEIVAFFGGWENLVPKQRVGILAAIDAAVAKAAETTVEGEAHEAEQQELLPPEAQ